MFDFKMLSIQLFLVSFFIPTPNCQAKFLPLHPHIGEQVLYEVQIRTANACHPEVGSIQQKENCHNKMAPDVFQTPSRCPASTLQELRKIRLGTLDDFLAETNDYHQGITLNYIHGQVKANTLWVMPPFPNNDRYETPDVCDNLGSPYAVRDYMHIDGMLDQECIQKVNLNPTQWGYFPEDAPNVCHGTSAFKKFIDKAHRLGLKVMLDVALNHFGHNYLFSDYLHYRPITESENINVNDLWNFTKTYDQSLLYPEILESTEQLHENHHLETVIREVKQKCPHLQGSDFIRALNMWRVMTKWEKEQVSCLAPTYLEYWAPGFYMGKGSPHPAANIHDTFQNDWKDIKFLFHFENKYLFYPEFVRNREYFFRILNYWSSLGVDGFRLDHTTDPESKMMVNEWKYILSKVHFYAERRKQSRPLILAEEFHEQMAMSDVSDMMIDGYLGDMRGQGSGSESGSGTIKNTSFVEEVISRGDRFQSQMLVLRDLENHDEKRLLNGTGFNPWTGAGFWGIGAVSYGVPSLLMGQEFAEPWGLGFRRSDFLRSRFYGTQQHFNQGQTLVDYYGKMISERLSPFNSALHQSDKRFFPRPISIPISFTTKSWQKDERLFAQVRWNPTDYKVMLTFFNLWEVGNLNVTYQIPISIAQEIGIKDHFFYRLNDVINGEITNCRLGKEWRENLPIFMPEYMRMRWYRLERCADNAHL